MGEVYQYGTGVPKNEKEALKWDTKAADQHNPAAQIKMGDLYWYGRCVPEDKQEAVKLYPKAAAEQNDPKGQEEMGDAHRYTWGVGQNLEEAMKWYRKATDNGNQSAKSKLEKIQNARRRAEGYLKLALEGDTVAEIKLAHMYRDGQGVDRNYGEAAKWYGKAADQGITAALIWSKEAQEKLRTTKRGSNAI